MRVVIEEVGLQEKELRKLREDAGMNRKEFAEAFDIPLRTVEDWEAGKRKMPQYLLRLIAYKIKIDTRFPNKVAESEPFKQKKFDIICDAEGKKIVIINDICFKSRRMIDWNEIETYLKEFIGECFEIAESSERIYIGTDFPDEFCHSEDTQKLRRANIKAKAKLGWYRYDTRFAIPVYDENSELIRYNIFSTRMLVRCDEDGHLYLYDFVRTKKETSKPLEQ